VTLLIVEIEALTRINESKLRAAAVGIELGEHDAPVQHTKFRVWESGSC
jgi:hypothetical protein